MPFHCEFAFVIVIIVLVILALKCTSTNRMLAAAMLRLGGPCTEYRYDSVEFQQRYPVKLSNSTTPIYIVYHFCNRNNYQDILDEQFEQIYRVGLYEKVTAILIGCSCGGCEVVLEKLRNKYPKIRAFCEAVCPETASHENGTINEMLDFTREVPRNSYFLYIHSKGITRTAEAQQYWRKFMMHKLVDQYQLCLDLLDRGFLTVGTLLARFPTHYSGNFFWATSDYLKTLPNIPVERHSNRLLAEMLPLSRFRVGQHVSLGTDAYISCSLPGLKCGLYSHCIECKPSSILRVF